MTDSAFWAVLTKLILGTAVLVITVCGGALVFYLIDEARERFEVRRDRHAVVPPDDRARLNSAVRLGSRADVDDVPALRGDDGRVVRPFTQPAAKGFKRQ